MGVDPYVSVCLGFGRLSGVVTRMSVSTSDVDERTSDCRTGNVHKYVCTSQGWGWLRSGMVVRIRMVTVFGLYGGRNQGRVVFF